MIGRIRCLVENMQPELQLVLAMVGNNALKYALINFHRFVAGKQKSILKFGQHYCELSDFASLLSPVVSQCDLPLSHKLVN